VHALYVARVDELEPHHRIRVVCHSGQEAELKPEAVLALNLPGYTRLLDIGRRLRCAKCHEKGGVSVSVRSLEPRENYR
jgi:hypothetical protein